ncbi:hypothetical protein WDL1P2_00220 (plasmid) [Variovorax sp. WDL1]|nr:hypothetical protein CHC07_06599 [Variovorax sp. B4]PNG49765.1 hypothetical protein CHC06_05346 [Variovorax sp. B2]VTV18523.1 hypothetical protein WDL1P2_00220 [Variovorax sp. WDL1]
MGRPLTQVHIPFEIFLIFLCFLGLVVGAFALMRWWRLHHAPPPRTTAGRSYSQQLSRRFGDQRANASGKKLREAVHRQKRDGVRARPRG